MRANEGPRRPTKGKTQVNEGPQLVLCRAGQGRVLEGQGLPKLEPEPQALPCLMPEAWPEGTLVQKCKLLNLLLNTATAKIIYIYRKIRCISIHIHMIRARRAIGTFLFFFF